MSLNHILAPLAPSSSGLSIEVKSVLVSSASAQVSMGIGTTTTISAPPPAASRTITIPDIGSDSTMVLAPAGTTNTFGSSLVTTALGTMEMRSDAMLAYRAKPRTLLTDYFTSPPVGPGLPPPNPNTWLQVADSIDKTPPTGNTQVIDLIGNTLIISGPTNGGFWQGKGLQTVRNFDPSYDYDISMNIRMDATGTTDAAQTLEIQSADGTQLQTVMSYSLSEGLEYFIYSGAILHEVKKVNSVRDFGYNAGLPVIPVVLRKRGSMMQLLLNGLLMYTSEWYVNGAFNIRLMGYARDPVDTPGFEFSAFRLEMYPITRPTRVQPILPVLAGSGAGFDSVYVKDPELIKINGVYYMYYSGWNGVVFRSGVVSLGADMKAPVLGPRTPLTLSAGVDNGAPSVAWDGTNVWLYLQNGSGPGASIQYYRSTTPGSTSNFTYMGIAVLGGGTGVNAWRNGVYDASICRLPRNGVYYLYFTATSSTFNTYGYTRTQGVATATSLAGPWTIVGQCRSHNLSDNIAYGCEAVNVFYSPSTDSFHMQLTGGSLGNQEIISQYVSWDGLNFTPAWDFCLQGFNALVWSSYATGSGCWIVDDDGTLYVMYQAQAFNTIGTYTIGYCYYPSASAVVQRALVLT